MSGSAALDEESEGFLMEADPLEGGGSIDSGSGEDVEEERRMKEKMGGGYESGDGSGDGREGVGGHGRDGEGGAGGIGARRPFRSPSDIDLAEKASKVRLFIFWPRFSTITSFNRPLSSSWSLRPFFCSLIVQGSNLFHLIFFFFFFFLLFHRVCPSICPSYHLAF